MVIYPCTLCRKSFTQSGNLKIHALTHSREKPYLCTLCTKSFTYNGNLKSDMKKYWGENSYSCSLCTKCFKNDGNLKKHTGTHLLEKLYACLLCTKSFWRINFLKDIWESIKNHLREESLENQLSAGIWLEDQRRTL